MTTKLLANQLRGILTEPVEGFTVELPDEANLYEWRVWIEGPKDTCYDGGIFQLSLIFPKDYPMAPPELKFVSEFWHPNVFSTGKVCMSILHPPGEDAMSGELPEERWLPTQSVTTIILSLLSLLNDPNCASPANVDASVEWRNHRDRYKARCAKLVEKANRDRPSHVVIPHPDTDAEQRKRTVQKYHEMNKDLDYEDFYEEADADGGDAENESGDENEFLESESEEDIKSGDESHKEEEEEKEKEKKVEQNGATPSPRRSHDNEVAAGGDVIKKEEEKVDVPQAVKDVKGKGKEEEEEIRIVSNDDVASAAPANDHVTPPPPTASADPVVVQAPAVVAAAAATVASSSSSHAPASASSSQPAHAESSSSSNANNNNNNDDVAGGGRKKRRSKSGKKSKKCVIM